MRNTEERLLAVKLRVREIESQKRIRTRRVLCMASFAGSLLLIVGLSFFMPGIMASMPDNKYSDFGTVASIFDGSSFFGFVMTGFLAFVLGVSLTILSYKIKKLNQQDQEGNE